ncbi:hypothetical protein [Micromonospora sp. NPDC049374]|uniref:hypothetical protein n=1 Tax=Micromonospora sp. NPDC049374 TaxID=3154352 RepID=UPI00342473AF
MDNALQLVPDRAQDRHMLLRILARAVSHWASPLGRPQGQVTPFKVLLLCDRDEEAVQLRQDITQALHNGHVVSQRLTRRVHGLSRSQMASR